MGIQPPSPDQRTWMIFESSGNRRRNAATVSGAAPSSKRAVKESPEAVISITSGTLVQEPEVPFERPVGEVPRDVGLGVDVGVALTEKREELPAQAKRRDVDAIVRGRAEP